MSHRWYVKQHAGEAGPYSWGELQYLARRDKLPPQSLVRRSDSAEWLAAARIVGLFSSPVAASTARAKAPLPAAAPKEATLTPPPAPNARLIAPPGLPPPLPKASERRWIAAAIGGGGLLAALLLIVLLFSLLHPTVGQGDHQSAGTASGSGEGAGNGTGGGNEEGEGAGKDKNQAATSSPGEPNGEIVAGGRGDERENADELAPLAGMPEASSPPTAATPAAPSTPPTTVPGQASSSSATPRVRPPRAAAVIRPLEDDSSAVAAGNGSGTSSGSSSQFFQIRAKGRSFAYIVDCSSSMSGEPFEKARQELIASIQALKSNQRFFVIFFSSDAYPQFFPLADRRLLPANAANKQHVTEWIAGFTASGGTEPLDAILQGLSLDPDAMYLLSDGEFDPQIADELRQRNGGRIPVHTIAFMDLVAKPLLEQIARENNGVFRFVP
jgi:hypothetical protein